MTFTRSYQSTSVLSSKRNVGVRHRVKTAKDDSKAMVQMLDEDPGETFLYELLSIPTLTSLLFTEFDPDSDFMEADISHKQHQKEMSEYKEKLGHWVVRDKYFKQKSPNFLTWAEKEHIRHLHQEDPDEWSIQNLCDSFPIDIHHINKLLKNKWAPVNANRVEKHDESVKQNWDMFRNGQLDDQLSPKLRAHLMKFKDRQVNLQALPKFEPKRKMSEQIKTKNDEFLKIITSCKEYKDIKRINETPKKDIKQIVSHNPKFTDYKALMNAQGVDTNKRMTLQELQQLLGEDEDDVNKPIEIEEKQMQLPANPAGTGVVRKESQFTSGSIDFPKKYDVQVAKQKDLDEMKVSPIKENIRIPKRLWKRNATYKYKDCFYDDDGELLYRVPGLTK